MFNTSPLIISSEHYGKKITMELPRDSSWEDYIHAFNTLLKFNTFETTVQELVYEEVSQQVYDEIEKDNNLTLSQIDGLD